MIKQAFYMLGWALFYSLIEFVTLHTWKGISHHHGWNIGWSTLVNMLTFPMLRLHFKSPLWACFLSFIATVLFSLAFKLPVDKMK